MIYILYNIKYKNCFCFQFLCRLGSDIKDRLFQIRLSAPWWTDKVWLSAWRPRLSYPKYINVRLFTTGFPPLFPLVHKGVSIHRRME